MTRLRKCRLRQKWGVEEKQGAWASEVERKGRSGNASQLTSLYGGLWSYTDTNKRLGSSESKSILYSELDFNWLNRRPFHCINIEVESGETEADQPKR